MKGNRFDTSTALGFQLHCGEQKANIEGLSFGTDWTTMTDISQFRTVAGWRAVLGLHSVRRP